MQTVCTNKVFKNKRGLNVHMRIAHKLNEDTAGAPVATTVNSSPEPSMQSTSINDIQTEFREFKDFMIAVVNSLGSKFEKELITIKNRISEINPRFTKETPAPSNIDTPYMIATNNTDTQYITMKRSAVNNSTIPKPCIQLANRFSTLSDETPNISPVETGHIQTTTRTQPSKPWDYNIVNNSQRRPFINQRPKMTTYQLELFLEI